MKKNLKSTDIGKLPREFMRDNYYLNEWSENTASYGSVTNRIRVYDEQMSKNNWKII